VGSTRINIQLREVNCDFGIARECAMREIRTAGYAVPLAVARLEEVELRVKHTVRVHYESDGLVIQEGTYEVWGVW
jgi:hypothetical protein